MEEPTTPDEMNDTSNSTSDFDGADNNTDANVDEVTDLTEDAPETGARFETPPPPPPPPPTGAPAPAYAGSGVLPKRLSRTNGPISGVAGGLGDYLSVDPTLVRMGIVLMTLLSGPVIPIAYVAAWIIIPEDNPAPVAPLASPQQTPPTYTSAPEPVEVG